MTVDSLDLHLPVDGSTPSGWWWLKCGAAVSGAVVSCLWRDSG